MKFASRITCRRALRVAGIGLGVLISACDPCAGTPSCRVAERVAYTGHVVERATGDGVPNAVVIFARDSGVQLSTDSVRAESDDQGFFELTANAKSAGVVTGTLLVEPPGRPSYEVPNISMQTTNVGGDGGDLGRIVSDPYIVFIGEIRNRLAPNDSVVPYASVTFTRTGGIQIQPSVITTTADVNGRFFLEPEVSQPGTLTGMLTVSAAGFPHSYAIPISIDTRYRDVIPRDVTVLNIGAALQWAGEVYRRGSNAHTAGLEVDFARTGGIGVTPSTFTVTTDSAGIFPIQPSPQGEGTVVSRLTIHPPAPYPPFVIDDVQVHTVADDSVRLAGRWGYGAQAFSAIGFLYRTTMTPVDSGATIVFRRTGGVGTTPDTSIAVVNGRGYGQVQLATDAVGTLTGNVEVRLGEPYGTETVRAVNLTSAEDDVQRLEGVHLVGRWFPQIGQVVDSATRSPISGITVSFKRVSGVAISPDPFVATPNSNGYFAIRPQPLADGEVVGDLTFQPPPPYAAVTVPGVHLRSSMDDTLRFVGAWFLAPAK